MTHQQNMKKIAEEIIKKSSCKHCTIKSLQNKVIQMKYEKRLDELETDIKNELSEMLLNMHKHSIEDYIQSLKCDLEEMLDKKPETIESDFETILKKTIKTMFKDMIDEFESRTESLSEEIKDRLDDMFDDMFDDIIE